jgi:hypothetical protein
MPMTIFGNTVPLWQESLVLAIGGTRETLENQGRLSENRGINQDQD